MKAALMDLVKKLTEKGTLEQEEADALLADDSAPEVDFDQALPGTAADVLEVFLGEAGGESVEDSNGWLWSPMIRSGQFALRPGKNGKKVRRSLKVVAGKSKDPLKEIGLGDLVEAFDGDAVDVVTVPQSHANGPLENTGYIRGMKVMDAPIAKGPNKGKKVPTLFGGYDFTEPDVKEKAKRGTIPGRSCGILYNYENTETGTSWPCVVEHVALTARPWIRGMTPFGRRLSEGQDPPVELSLSDELPAEEGEIETELADGDGTISWSHEDSPSWVRQQISDLLQAAREEKRKKIRGASSGSFVEEMPPYYRAVDVKPEGESGKSLICDGYGDGANYWVADFKVVDGQVELDDFKDWQAVKSVYVPDDRTPPEKKNEPLDEPVVDPPTRIQVAQQRRKARVKGTDLSENKNPTHPRGGEKMDPKDTGSNGTGTLQLSEEAQARVAAIEAENERFRKDNERLSEKLDRLTNKDRESEVKAFLDELRAMNLDEKHGQTGLLNEVALILGEDDGEPAVVSEKFSENGDAEVELTLTDAFRRVFKAIKRGKDGKIALAEQLEQPSDGAKSTDASEKPDGKDGKPPKDEGGEDDLSVEGAEDRVQEYLDDNPELARIAPGAVKKKDGDS